jgi:type VI protein secretion system component Hcp
MKTKLFFLLSIISMITLSIQAQDFKVKKQGLEFPDKKVQREAWQGEPLINPPIGNVKIFAEIDGIDGDVIIDPFRDHTEFYNLDILLKATTGGPQNWPIGDPINKYFEVYKQVDEASVDLVQKFSMGQPIDRIRFKFVWNSSSVIELYRITANFVRIKDFELVFQYVEGGNPILFEKYTLFIEELTYENRTVPEAVNFNIFGNE